MTARRDKLVEIELWVQERWKQFDTYRIDAPTTWHDGDIKSKFLVTFPYPYANGRLHVGHAFTLTKADFSARFQKLLGKDVLFPFAFHCTGMPIQAAAGKLARELEASGQDEEGQEETEVSGSAPVVSTLSEPSSSSAAKLGVFKSKKGKVAAKGGAMAASEVLKSMGIPEEEIPLFCDPLHWLDYFPPYILSDVTRFGCGIDWRRSFITTDKNPYYDRFIRWQFRKLKDNGKIKFGNRPAVFSIRENQPCADHDRQSGEGVNPQEYTLIKLRVKEVPSSWNCDGEVYLVAATLRPETMYGQTNCFVLPAGQYGLFKATKAGEYYVCSKRAALNMSYQGTVADSKQVCMIKGQDLIGLPLSAPYTSYDTVYVLPMLTISMDKGTGVVTSVPADSPDDYACLRDWKTRPNWRHEYGVKEEWCVPFEVIPIIDIPGIGTESAMKACEEFGVESHKDKQKLEEAKQQCYLKGFYQGVMRIGEFAGRPVQDAKMLMKQKMIDSGDALVFYEPESLVISRSGDQCIVALCDQWYITYGEEDWLRAVRAYLEKPGNFTMFNQSASNQLLGAVEWLKDWACSRTFGLGTRLPWDEKWVIESLSDSTIYMSYYTIANLLQGDLNGSVPGELGIGPDELSDGVFDYVFGLVDEVPSSELGIAVESLEKMRKEFMYWYPLDLRVSGKDLISNHLTMALYSHAAIWEGREGMWPRSYFTNGMVTIDNQKMSKSLGNFLTMDQACRDYGSDATRIALADAGDDLETANFNRKTANDTILTLTTLENWLVTEIRKGSSGREGARTFTDLAFANEMARLQIEGKKAFEAMQFRRALKAVWFGFQNLRDQYKVLCGDDGMHRDLVKRYAEIQTLMLSPIAPHFSEYVWNKVLGNDTVLAKEGRWPEVGVVDGFDSSLSRKFQVLLDSLRLFRLDFLKYVAGGSKKNKNKDNNSSVQTPTDAIIFVAREYLPFQQTVLTTISRLISFDRETNEPLNKTGYMSVLKEGLKGIPGAEQSACLKFASYHIQTEVKERGAEEALQLTLPFDEVQMLYEQLGLIRKQLGVERVGIVGVGEEEEEVRRRDAVGKRNLAMPGRPSILFFRECDDC